MTKGGSPRNEAVPLAQLTELYHLLDRMQCASTAEAVCEAAGASLCSVLEVDQWAVLLRVGPDGPVIRGGGALTERGVEALRRFLPWAAAPREAAPLVVADTAAGRPELPPATPLAALTAEGIRSAVWVPLERRGRLLGELFLGRREPGGFGAGAVELAEAVAAHASHAIWRARDEAGQAEILRRSDTERSVLEAVVRHLPVGLLLADAASGRIVLTNRRVDEIWGRSLADTTGVDGYAEWGAIGDDRGRGPVERWPLARSVLRGEAVSGEEIRILRADGSRAIVRMSSTPVTDPRGRRVAAVATVLDVTADREAEAAQAFLEDVTALLNASIELETTLASLANSVVGAFADWCVIYRVVDGGVVERVASAHRNPDRREAVAAFSRGTIAPGTEHPVLRTIEQGTGRLVQDVPPDFHDVYLAGEDPETRAAAARLGAVSVMILPLMSRGKALGALSVVRERDPFGARDLELAEEVGRRAALALENALLYEKARTADRAKARFLAVMSHEFRTPLSAILGYSEILTARVHGELSGKQAEHLERIKASVRHLSHLVDEILSFASMEAGKERVIRSRLDSRSLVSDVADILAPMAEASGLSMRVHVPEAELVVIADPAKVRQVLINLISNAIKYTAEGGVEVELVREGENAVCRVRDTGPGIAPEHLERVFEPFWQVDRPTGAQVTGSGLGLAVARRLARLMGGDVLLESAPGEGSMFTLVLPLEQPPVADDSEA